MRKNDLFSEENNFGFSININPIIHYVTSIASERSARYALSALISRVHDQIGSATAMISMLLIIVEKISSMGIAPTSGLGESFLV